MSTAKDLLAELFSRTRAENRAALIGYLPAGYPDIPGSAALLDTIVDSGCDAVEVGLPFSDPVLDGPVICSAQRASLAAGWRTRDVFPLVERVAGRGAVPIVMSYVNPLLAYGLDAFARDLAAAGGAGVITPDLIVDEADEWRAATAAHGIDPIFLVAPSSPADRIALTTAACRGFVYASSVMGTTGARDTVSHDAPDLVARCRQHTDLPIGVGLGVRTRAQAAEIASFADAVIVGSALVTAGEGGPGPLGALVAELAAGVREPSGPREVRV
jgi:tryptophan synthase alpha chain